MTAFGALATARQRKGAGLETHDVPPNMAQKGLSPTLFVQPMHELDPPRRYKTIFICGAFGLGSTREQDFEALRRFHEYLELKSQ